jgi:hypothetical protein
MSDSTMTGSGSASNSDFTPAKRSQNGPRPVLGDVKELGGQLASAARKGANSLYEEQRNRAAAEISALGESLGRSAKSLDGTIGEAVAPYAEDAARQVEDFAGTLRDKSIGELGSDVEGFARQWPMAFMAAAVGAGFLAGRFLLSSHKPAEAGANKNSLNASGDATGTEGRAAPGVKGQGAAAEPAAPKSGKGEP